jgi:hypothetical protein
LRSRQASRPAAFLFRPAGADRRWKAVRPWLEDRAEELRAVASASLVTFASLRSGRLNLLPRAVASGSADACTAPGSSITR